MNNKVKGFCEDVCGFVKHAAPWEKLDISKELSDHIEDHAEDLMKYGYSEEDAYERAVAAMGNPDEIGGELNKQYPIFWLVLSRIPLFIIAVLLFQFWGVQQSLGLIRDNIFARTNPYLKLNDFEIVQEMDPESIKRIDFRSDLPGENVLRVFAYKEGFEIPEDRAYRDLGYDRYALVFVCMYNKKPTQAINDYSVYHLKSRRREFLHTGYPKNGSYGVLYHVLEVPYNTDDGSIQFCYDAYLQTIQLSIDINQEEAGI